MVADDNETLDDEPNPTSPPQVSQRGPVPVSKSGKPWLSALVAILLFVPCFIPAAMVVMLYKAFLGNIVSGHWIPYWEELSLMWFPELLRGVIVGYLTILLTSKIVKNVDLNVARYSTFCFWGGIWLFLTIFGVLSPAVSWLSVVGTIAALIGIGVGLWMDEIV